MASLHPEAAAPRSSVYKNDSNLFINQRPTFKAWIKSVWLDVLTLAITGAISHGVIYSGSFYRMPRSSNKTF